MTLITRLKKKIKKYFFKKKKKFIISQLIIGHLNEQHKNRCNPHSSIFFNSFILIVFISRDFIVTTYYPNIGFTSKKWDQNNILRRV